ncbi:MAG: AAA family ATPase [Campylobacter hyointestinalis]
MSRFGFIKSINISELNALDERKVLIDGFLLEKSINIIWGRSGLGKTWLCFAIAKYLANLGFESVYIDADNGVDLIKDRGYDAVIKELGGMITYINADFMDDARAEMADVFDKLEKNATNGYDGAIFILDSLSFFLGDGVYDEIKIHKFITFAKRLRRAGGTIIIIAHATKGGSNIRGSSSLINSVDEVWEAATHPAKTGEINFTLSPYKQRLNVRESAFNIKCDGCELTLAKSDDIKLDERENSIVQSVRELLKDGELSQNKIYAGLNKSKGDRAVQKLLERFCGVYWQKLSGANKSQNYKLI